MLDLHTTKIGIIGLGYVGLPLAVEFGKKYPTLGFDINQARITELKSGKDSTLEVTSEGLLAAKHLEFSNDSKKLSAKRRERLYDEIRAKALCCSVAQASVEEIDQLNILQATMLAMRRAVQGLRLKPSKVLVDGNRLPPLDVLTEAIVCGDALVPSISAASILAKVTRDRLLCELHLQYPEYGFDRHKGYGTAQHMRALQMHGPLAVHRRSFAPVARALGTPSCDDENTT